MHEKKPPNNQKACQFILKELYWTGEAYGMGSFGAFFLKASNRVISINKINKSLLFLNMSCTVVFQLIN